MELTKFPEQTTTYAANQPQYNPLPAHIFPNDPNGRIAFCWKLTPRERLLLLLTGKLWHEVLTFHAPLQPQKISLAKPKMHTRFPFRAWTFWRICVTWCIQAQGAPFADRTTVHEREGRTFHGYAFVMRFWKMRPGNYGNTVTKFRTPEPMAALVIAWKRKLPATTAAPPDQEHAFKCPKCNTHRVNWKNDLFTCMECGHSYDKPGKAPAA